MEKEKVERTVVHVELLCDNSHHYFGSLAAIYEKFNKEIRLERSREHLPGGSNRQIPFSLQIQAKEGVAGNHG